MISLTVYKMVATQLKLSDGVLKNTENQSMLHKCTMHKPQTTVKEPYKYSVFDKSVFTRYLVIISLTGLCLTATVFCFVLRGLVQKDLEWIQLDENGPEGYTVPCEALSLSSDEDLDTFDTIKYNVKIHRDVNGTRICSFTNLTHVVERAAEKYARLRVAEGLVLPDYLSCGNLSKRPQAGENIAYFTELTDNNNDKTGQHDDILHWNTDPTSSFVGVGFTYEKGRIRINSTQLYYVYASIMFNKSSQLRESNGYMQELFYVTVETATKYNGTEYTVRNVLLADTVKDCNGGIGTVYVGSQMYLEKGHVLYVAVSEGRRVMKSAQGNRFGVYAT